MMLMQTKNFEELGYTQYQSGVIGHHNYMNISNRDNDLLLKPNFVTSFLEQSLSLQAQSLCKNSKKETKSSQQTIPIITKLI